VTKEKNFYYSNNAFQFLKVESWEDEAVNEALIDGKWQVFTEQVPKGIEPLSKNWGDLVFIGSNAETRCIRYSKWLEMQREEQ
jgi:hypothetical protein